MEPHVTKIDREFETEAADEILGREDGAERCVRTWTGVGANTRVPVAARAADSASSSTTAMSESARSGARDLATAARGRGLVTAA